MIPLPRFSYIYWLIYFNKISPLFSKLVITGMQPLFAHNDRLVIKRPTLFVVKVLLSHFLGCFILLGSVGLRGTILSVLICLEFASLSQQH